MKSKYVDNIYSTSIKTDIKGFIDAEKIQELKNCGAVNYQRLPLKIKLNLWLIGKGHK